MTDKTEIEKTDDAAPPVDPAPETERAVPPRPEKVPGSYGYGIYGEGPYGGRTKGSQR